MVTVCICTRERLAELERALASVAGSSVLPGQVVVSDDGRNELAEDVCARAPIPVSYTRGPRIGLGANRNSALALATCEYVAFIDDDCLLGPTFIQEALTAMEGAEAAHGSQRVIISGSELNRGRVVMAHEQTFFGFQSRPYAPDEPLRTIVINATLLPRRLFDQVEFDARLSYGLDEVDLATRAVAAGFVIVNAPAAQNDHRPSPNAREGNEAAQDASRLYITLKRYAFTERRFGRAALFALAAPVHLLVSRVKRHGVSRGLSMSLSILRDAGHKLAGEMAAHAGSSR